MNPERRNSLYRRAFAETCDPSAYVPRRATEAVLGRMESWLEMGAEAASESPENPVATPSSVGVLLGEPGIGKTQLLRLMEARHSRDVMGEGGCSIYLPYAGLAPADLCHWIFGLIGQQIPETSRAALASEEASTAATAALDLLLDLGRHEGAATCFLLAIDDADSMPPDTAEMISAIGRTAKTRESGTRILLALNRDARAAKLIASLGETAPVSFDLHDRLTLEETGDYLRERLALAGVAPAEIDSLDSESIGRVQSLSGGLPRQIHAVADRVFGVNDSDRSDALDQKLRREDWMGQPIEDDFVL